jgi:tRNA 2-thiocytidine biosynthesis protein TtcA
MSLGLQIPQAQPPWSQLGRQLESQIRKAIYEFDLIPKEGHLKVAIALSGGKDSLALLFFLHALSARGLAKLDLCAIHVHGAYSCGAGVSLNYLKAICQNLSISFVVKESNQSADDLECYSCSRERRKLLFDAAKDFGANLVAFGHHLDDNAQTLMLNMLHKAVPAGMLPKVPMIHYGVTIIRPMILCREADIIQFAEQYGFRRITCQCPVGQHSKRKRVQEWLNEITRDFPNAASNLSDVSLKWGDQSALTP